MRGRMFWKGPWPSSPAGLRATSPPSWGVRASDPRGPALGTPNKPPETPGRTGRPGGGPRGEGAAPQEGETFPQESEGRDLCRAPGSLPRGPARGRGNRCQGPWAPSCPPRSLGASGARGCSPAPHPAAPGPPAPQHPQQVEEAAASPLLPLSRQDPEAGDNGCFFEDAGRGRAHSGSELGGRQTVSAGRPCGAQLGGHQCPGRATWQGVWSLTARWERRSGLEDR